MMVKRADRRSAVGSSKANDFLEAKLVERFDEPACKQRELANEFEAWTGKGNGQNRGKGVEAIIRN